MGEKEVIKKSRNAGFEQQDQGNLIDMDDGSSTNQQQRMNTQILIQQLQERERSIRQLESDIVDVNTIFKDLATMVHEQGEIVDSIEANVESTTVRVHEGADQLRQAEMYKNKARKKKVILSVVGVTILVILIAIIAWQAN